MDESEDRPAKNVGAELGGDLSTWSLGDIDERVAELEAEIKRLKEERSRKASSLDAAEAFFKTAQ